MVKNFVTQSSAIASSVKLCNSVGESKLTVPVVDISKGNFLLNTVQMMCTSGENEQTCLQYEYTLHSTY